MKTLGIPLPRFEWLGDTTRLTSHHIHFLHLGSVQGVAATGAAFGQLADTFCHRWVAYVVQCYGKPVLDALSTSRYFGYSNEEWRRVYHATWTQTPAAITSDDDDDESKADSLLVWLPWCATPDVSHCSLTWLRK
ncbi:hypothetical protein H310_14617 [Aphanomyces invadans]|uniref:Uncharacterized protein n=1 Tax=Aphanomyces invadans TaxID=157072 RepID=A0A024T934_9STRA|nr:hypothetical protein H310_14617 [Aphanomyces invadans]ETV90665.1 hypothetical protein H310_14617 [Aphanomyces invadans]|eukprot:XP_008880735.1 hypothetical protein H310_14617 [Aphanomyces invadans]